jgi:hypothetical protein
MAIWLPAGSFLALAASAAALLRAREIGTTSAPPS